MGKWKVNFLLKCLHGARPGSLHPCLWWYRKTCFRSYYLCLLAWWCTPGKIWASTRMSVVYPAFYASSSASCYPVSSQETLWNRRVMAMCQLFAQYLLAPRRSFLKMQVMTIWVNVVLYVSIFSCVFPVYDVQNKWTLQCWNKLGNQQCLSSSLRHKTLSNFARESISKTCN